MIAVIQYEYGLEESNAHHSYGNPDKRQQKIIFCLLDKKDLSSCRTIAYLLIYFY